MEQPRISQYFQARQFLKDFADWKKQSQASWSLGSWAKHLGLGGTSSISRILSGDRVIGEDLYQALKNYFKFKDEEEKYFKKLVDRERYYRSGKFAEEPVIQLLNSQLLVLGGVIDPDSARDFLSPWGLEPLSIGGKVRASVHMNSHPEASVGAFTESYLCFTVIPKGGGMLDAGLFFTAFLSNNFAASKAIYDFGAYMAQMAPVELKRNHQKIFAEIGAHAEPFLSLSLNKEMSFIEEKYEMNFYSTHDDQLFRAKFTIDSLGRQCAYDANTDTYNHYLSPVLSQLVQKFNFKPERWVLHESLYSHIFQPKLVTAFGTY